MATKLQRKWWPESKVGKKALIFCALVVIYGILMPSIPSSILTWHGLGAISGLIVVSNEAILVVAALVFSWKAIFKGVEAPSDVLILSDNNLGCKMKVH